MSLRVVLRAKRTKLYREAAVIKDTAVTSSGFVSKANKIVSRSITDLKVLDASARSAQVRFRFTESLELTIR